MKFASIHVLLYGLAASLATPCFAELSLTSSVFQNGGAIPKAHACHAKGGENLSIPLAWAGVAADVQSFALVMDDETSPCRKGDGACRHWGVFNVPTTVSSLKAGHAWSETPGVVLGKSYSGQIGYDGMCPPGPHEYKITLYGLRSSMPKLEGEIAITRSQFESMYQAHIVEKSTLTGSFSPW